MAHFQKLKNQARREEQRGRWVQAIELYKQAIRLEEDSGASSVDFGLYNRVGDLYLKQGDTATAVDYYETAVDSYAGHDLHTSAIALCNKILRIAPGRTAVYRKLGRLHAQTGLVAEARSNFLEYAGRTQENGQLTEALEALQEFVDMVEDDEIRCTFAEELVQQGLTDDALAQLRMVWRSRIKSGASAEQIESRILELDPSADLSPPALESPEVSEPEAVDVISGDDSGVTVEAGTVRLGDLVLNGSGDTRTLATLNQEAAAVPSVQLGSASPELRETIEQFRVAARDTVDDAGPAVHYDLGIAYHQMGLFDEAVSEFQKAIQSPTYLQAAYEMLGKCMADKAKEPAATAESAAIAEPGESVLEIDELMTEPLLEEPRAAEPAEAEVAEPETADDQVSGSDDYAGLLFEARLAQFRARQAEDKHETDYQAHLDLGEAYRGMGLIEEALTEFRVACSGSAGVGARTLRKLEAMLSTPELTEAHRLEILEILKGKGRTETALAGYRALIEERTAAGRSAGDLLAIIDALDPAASTMNADALPQLDEMLAELDAVSDLPDTPVSLPQAASAELSPEAPVPAAPVDSEAYQVISEARAMVEQGRKDLAVDSLSEAFQQFESVRQHEPAAEVLDELLGLSPDDVVLHYSRVELAIALNDREALIRSYLLLGAALRRQHASTSARSVFGRLLDIDPENEEARLAIAEIDEVDVLLEEMRAHGEDDSSPELAEVVEYKDMEEAEVEPAPEEVQADPAKAQSVPAAPQSAPAAPTSIRNAKESEFDELLGDIRAASKKPLAGDYDAHYDLGLAYLDMEMPEQAIREFQIAIQGQSKPIPAYQRLGESFLATEKPRLAIKALLPADELDQFNENEKTGVLYVLGLAHEGAGEDEKAIEYYERVCAADVNHRDAAERLQGLTNSSL
ncbi:MAG: tetratricopeptide repeat protein [Gemmatimonadota bacterium]